MIATSIYLKISIFIEIGQSWNFCDIVAILKKNGGSGENFDRPIMFATSNYPMISIFIEIGESWHFREMAAILKKIWWFGK